VIAASIIRPSLVLALASFSGCFGGRSDPRLTGSYVWGAEVNTFRPCGSSLVYWVNAADTAQFRLEREHQRLTSEPYEPVFVELCGEIGEVPFLYADGFAGDYDGMITLSCLGEIRALRPGECE
jgi:hypothetical protein